MTEEYQIRYLPAAQKDLLDIFSYIAKEDREAAAGTLKQLEAQIEKLADFPLMAPQPKDPILRKLGYRFLIVEKYLVFYVVKGTVVQIRRVLHVSRDYSRFEWAG